MKFNDIPKNIRSHNGLSWVNKEDKLLFLGIPKNASSSIRKTWESKGLDRCHFNNKSFEEYKKFTIIRNPLDRFASGVTEIYTRRGTGEIKYPMTTIHELSSANDIVKNVISLIRKYSFVDVHIAPQIFYLRDQGNEFFQLDYILLFENLKDDLLQMYNDISKNVKLRFENKTKNHILKNQILQIISEDQRIKDDIKELYLEDFEYYDKISKR